MSHPCSTGCGTTVTDAFVCWTCGDGMRSALVELLDQPHPVWPGERLPGLLVNLDETLARQDALERAYARPEDEESWEDLLDSRRPGVELLARRDPLPRSSLRSVPYDLRASVARDHLRAILVGWVRLLLEERQGASDKAAPEKTVQGPACVACKHPSCGRVRQSERLSPLPGYLRTPEDTLDALAAFLLAHSDRLRFHEAGHEAVDEIWDAVRRVRRVVDRAGDVWYAGRCGCLADLYATDHARSITCPGCGTPYDVEERRQALLEAVEDSLATATEIARALTSLDSPVTRNAIYGYAHRNRIEVKGHNRAGHPVYRVGDILHLVNEEKERAS